LTNEEDTQYDSNMDSQYMQFIDELLAKRHVPDVTPEIREEMKREAMERLDDFLLQRILEAFSEEDSDTFIAIIQEKKSQQELFDFAKEHITGYDDFMKSTFSDFAPAIVNLSKMRQYTHDFLLLIL